MRSPFVICLTLLLSTVFGFDYAFILQDADSEEILIHEGETSTRMSPYCSFNIALSLIGFETGVLEDTENPSRPFQHAYEEDYTTWGGRFPDEWRGPHNPTSWMKYSCVWYSQATAQQIGIENLTNYIEAFDYGNQNLTGDANKENGLTRSWIGSSLRISPQEQIAFINKLVRQELPVSIQTHELTKSILFIEQLPNGMLLYGKTGGGNYAHGRQAPQSNVSWFVGFVEQGYRQLSFVYRISSKNDEEIPRAREHLKQRLLQLTAAL